MTIADDVSVVISDIDDVSVVVVSDFDDVSYVVSDSDVGAVAISSTRLQGTDHVISG